MRDTDGERDTGCTRYANRLVKGILCLQTQVLTYAMVQYRPVSAYEREDRETLKESEGSETGKSKKEMGSLPSPDPSIQVGRSHIIKPNL